MVKEARRQAGSGMLATGVCPDGASHRFVSVVLLGVRQPAKLPACLWVLLDLRHGESW